MASTLSSGWPSSVALRMCRAFFRSIGGKERTPMADKPSLSINYHTGTIQGPSAVISNLFATPKTKSWDWLPEATIVISDPQRLRQTVARLRQLGYPLVEQPPSPLE